MRDRRRRRDTLSPWFVLLVAKLTGCQQLLELDDPVPGAVELTGADFTRRSADLEVDADGVLRPVPWVFGALLASGSDEEVFVDPTTAVWAAPPPTTLASLGAPRVVGGVPVGTTVIGADTWTWWLEGEIWLDAGTHGWLLQTDDNGFVDLALPGEGSYTRVVATRFGELGVTESDAPVSGWYPLRVALGNGPSGAQLTLLHRAPASDAYTPLAPHHLRAPARSFQGLAVQLFADSLLVGDRGIVLDDSPSLATSLAPALLGDSPAARSARWSGQLLVAADGEYRFRLTAAAGARVRIDGVLAVDAWSQTTVDTVSEGQQLTAGWHDVLIDHRGDAGALELRIEAGPDRALVGVPLPRERLRPVSGGDHRLYSTTLAAAVAIADAATTEAPLPVDLPLDAVIASADVWLRAEHAAWSDLAVDLRAPSGVAHRVARFSSFAGTGTFSTTLKDAAGEQAGPWSMVVSDALAGNTGTLLAANLAIQYRSSAFDAVAAAETEVFATGASDGLLATWSADTPAGAALTVLIRTCDAPAICLASPWTPLTADVPVASAGDHAQLRVELDGLVRAPPGLSTVTITPR